MTTGKTIALTRWTFVGKLISLLLNMLSEALNNQWYGWIGLCGSYYDWRMPFLITIMELWKNKFIALKIRKLQSTPRATLWGHEERERDRETWRERKRENGPQFSHSVMSDSLRPHELQHARLPCPSPIPGACLNSCTLSQWCHPTISPCVIPFSSCLSSFPATGSFLMSQFFASGGQSVGVSASASCAHKENGPGILFYWGQG